MQLCFPGHGWTMPARNVAQTYRIRRDPSSRHRLRILHCRQDFFRQIQGWLPSKTSEENFVGSTTLVVLRFRTHGTSERRNTFNILVSKRSRPLPPDSHSRADYPMARSNATI